MDAAPQQNPGPLTPVGLSRPDRVITHFTQRFVMGDVVMGDVVDEVDLFRIRLGIGAAVALGFLEPTSSPATRSPSA